MNEHRGKGGGGDCVARAVPLLLFILAVTAGCAVPHVASRVVYEDPANFIRIEKDPTVFVELPHTLHSHPAFISQDTFKDILKGLAVREHRTAVQVLIAGEAAKEPAFRDAEVELLAPRLSEALALADPSERVTYYLSHPQTSIKREITTGGLYVRDGRLHFILGNHRVIYGIPAYGMVYDRRYPTMPTAAKGFDLFFEPSDAVVPQVDGLWDRMMGRVKDEMVIDLGKLGGKRAVVQGATNGQELRVLCRGRQGERPVWRRVTVSTGSLAGQIHVLLSSCRSGLRPVGYLERLAALGRSEALPQRASS